MPRPPASAVAQSTLTAPPAGAAGFVPALEGMRACAALAVVLTHTAFQTGQIDGSIPGRVWGRFDLAVAVFFALSGFLLWRGHARAAWTGEPRPATGRYYRSRLVRIAPAYLVVAVVALTLLPRADPLAPSTWFANLTLTQVFVPFALTDGLTQMWSLSVEVSFYLLLPVGALLLRRFRGPRARWRIPLLALGVAGALTWVWVGQWLPLPRGVNHHNWLPSYLVWFGAGLVLAELAVAPVDRYQALRRRTSKWLWWPIAAVTFAVAVTPLAGPVTLDTPQSWQFALRMILGGVLAFALLLPLVLAPAGSPAGVLGSGPMLALGRWSYGIFIWHLVVLVAIFPLFSTIAFSGAMVKVSVLTIATSAAVAALSYAWVEEPARRALARFEARTAAAARTHGRVGTADQPTSSTPANANP